MGFIEKKANFAQEESILIDCLAVKLFSEIIAESFIGKTEVEAHDGL